MTIRRLFYIVHSKTQRSQTVINYHLTVSEGQEFISGLAGSFRLRVFLDVAVKMSDRTAVA